MAFKGCRYPKYCPYTVTQNPDGTETEALGVGKVFGKSANVTITINADTVKYAANDGTAEAVTEFTDGTVQTEIDNLTDETNAEIGGHVIDENGVVHYGAEDSPPYVRYSIIVPERVSGRNKFKVKELTRVQFAPPGGTFNSKADATSLSGITLNGEVMRAANGEYQNDSPSFDTEAQALAWQATEMNMPSSHDPLTCTPTPADDATGVAVDANVVLTFNNPIDHGDAILIKASDNSIISAVKTFNGAKTVLTINPNTNLTTATAYAVIVHNMTDAYGQTLADTVYTFTTA